MRPRKSQPPDLYASVCVRCFFATCAQREASAKSGVNGAFGKGTHLKIPKVTPFSSIMRDGWGDATCMRFVGFWPKIFHNGREIPRFPTDG